MHAVSALQLCSLTSAVFLFGESIPDQGEFTTYTVAEIPIANAVPQSINSAGDVAGYINGPSGAIAFTWIDGIVTQLPPPSGHSGAIAREINDNGVVVGTTSPFPAMAVRWTNGVAEALGTLGGAWSSAESVNASGEVVGWALIEQTSTRFHGYVRTNDEMESVGLLFGGVATQLLDINDSGIAVGSGITASSHWRAMLFDPAEGLRELPTLGGVSSEATAISNAGHVTGIAQTGVANPSTFEGIERHAFVWHNGRMLDLGVLPGKVESHGRDVNSSGQVIGVSTNANGSGFVPFIWQDGAMIDLNALIPANSGWVLVDVTAINDNGQIVGVGSRNGQSRGFVLTPVAGPASSRSIAKEPRP